jgi:hypothetical protein
MTQETWRPLAEYFPELAADLQAGLLAQGRADLARSVADLYVVGRCECISEDCATFQTASGRGVPVGVTEEDVEYVYDCLKQYGEGIVFALGQDVQRVELLALTEKGERVREELRRMFP